MQISKIIKRKLWHFETNRCKEMKNFQDTERAQTFNRRGQEEIYTRVHNSVYVNEITFSALLTYFLIRIIILNHDRN